MGGVVPGVFRSSVWSGKELLRVCETLLPAWGAAAVVLAEAAGGLGSCEGDSFETLASFAVGSTSYQQQTSSHARLPLGLNVLTTSASTVKS